MADYDAFISYSHDADGVLAPAIHDGLQKLAKPWNKRRSLNVFLDKSSLEVASDLKEALHKKLSSSHWLVLLLSEESAHSEWVGEEIKEWAATRPEQTIALVLTDGELVWADGDFDPKLSTAASPSLRGVFDEEPLWLDLRWTRGEPELDIRQNPRFKDDLATLAAPLHGKSKEDIVGDDLDQFRKSRRLRRAAIASLTMLTVIAVVAGVIAWFQRAEAVQEAQRATSRALAADALNSAVSEPDLAALLALESVRIANTTDARGSLVGVLGLPTRFLQRTNAHDGEQVTAIAFSEDGLLAATGDGLGRVKIWGVAADPSASPQAETTGLEFELPTAARELSVFAEDGFAIAFDIDGNLHLLNLELGTVDTFPAPEPFEIAAVSPEFTFLAGVTFDGVLFVYSIEDDVDGLGFAELNAIEVGTATDLTFSPDELHLAWGEDDVFVLWQWDNNDLWPLPLETDVSSLAFSPDNSTVAVGEVEGRIHLIDLSQGIEPLIESTDASLLIDEVDPSPVNQPVDIAFEPDLTGGTAESGTFALVSAHINGEVILWTVFRGDGFSPFGFAEEVLLGHKEVTTSVAFSPDGRIASGSFDGEVIWWNDLPLSSLGVPFFGDDDTPTDMAATAFVNDGTVVGYDFDTVWAWDLDTFETKTLMDGAEGLDVWSLDAAAGSIAVGLVDGSALLLQEDGIELARLGPAHDAPVDVVAMSNDGTGLATLSRQEEAARLVVWDVATRSERSRLNIPDDFAPESLLFGSDGSVWLGGGKEAGGTVLKIDADTGEVRQEILHGGFPGDAVTALGLSGDGATLATGGLDRAIRLWDLETETIQPRDGAFEGHREAVTGIAFTDGGETLISSDQAGDVVMWDVSLRRQITRLGGPTDGINALDINGSTVAAASEDDVVWLWTLDQEEWRERACLLAGRNMTPAEWDRFGSGSPVQHCPQWPGQGKEAVYSDRLTD